MRAILVLMDSLNRHMLKIYNEGAKTIAPNISRLAERSVVFDNHYIASAPCMPARRDILTGRVNFLERAWGPIEPQDPCFLRNLRANGIFSHMVTDHDHYAELGGEGYLQQFDTWEFIRGQECDPWVSRVKDPDMPQNIYGRTHRQYQLNRTQFHTEADFSTPQTFDKAVNWLKDNEFADNYFLTVEVFDPHEPFDTPDEILKLYETDYHGKEYEWSGYCPVSEPPEAVEHLRNKYLATLTMADRGLGRLLDEIDRQNIWEDTLIILTTDHGHMLGEHGFTGKNYCHAYNEMAHIPLMIHLPGGERAGMRVKALTQNIDLMPTLLDYYGIPLENRIHGRSWYPLLDGTKEKIRDYAIYGWFGMPVNITDGKSCYLRSAYGEENSPLCAYTSMPTVFQGFLGTDLEEERISMGRFLPWCNFPVYRFDLSGKQPRNPYVGESLLFDLERDPGQLNPMNDAVLEKKMCDALIAALLQHDAPPEQKKRLFG